MYRVRKSNASIMRSLKKAKKILRRRPKKTYGTIGPYKILNKHSESGSQAKILIAQDSKKQQ